MRLLQREPSRLVYEKCKHNNNEACPFAAWSQGKLRCGLAAVSLEENDVFLFEKCVKDIKTIRKRKIEEREPIKTIEPVKISRKSISNNTGNLF